MTDGGGSTEMPMGRLASIDVMRGLTMVVMIFVNELSSVKGLPWWTYHAQTEWDAMTYVDMVFPFFLFVVGLSLPLAIGSRLKRNGSVAALWGHVLLRTASLMVLGLILANADDGDAGRMVLRPEVWALVGIAGCALFLNEYDGGKWLGVRAEWWKGLGVAVVAGMFLLYRHKPGEGAGGWIDFEYPEILGLIGYTYLAVCLLYIPTRRWWWAPLAGYVAMMGLNVGMAGRWIVLPAGFDYWVWPWNNGAMAGIVFGGMVTAGIFLGEHSRPELKQKVGLAVGFAAASLAAGWLAIPLGISKNRATPTWSLVCVGAAVLVFTALYWICDVKKRTGWALFARSAGGNTLTTYLLPDVWGFGMMAVGFTYFAGHWDQGWAGVVRCVVFTGMILGISSVLTRWRVRLRL